MPEQTVPAPNRDRSIGSVCATAKFIDDPDFHRGGRWHITAPSGAVIANIVTTRANTAQVVREIRSWSAANNGGEITIVISTAAITAYREVQ